MFDGKSKEDILRLWLKAAKEFSQSPTPHVSAFGKLTGQAQWHWDGCEDLWFAIHIVEEIARARAATNPNKVDQVLLRSRLATTSIEGRSRDLIDECVKSGIITSAEDGKVELDAIRDAMRRRRREIGLKGRGYFFD